MLFVTTQLKISSEFCVEATKRCTSVSAYAFPSTNELTSIQENHQKQSTAAKTRPMSQKEPWLSARFRVLLRHFIVLCMISPLDARSLNTSSSMPVPTWRMYVETLLCI